MQKNEMEYFRLFRDVCKLMNSTLDVKEVLNLITEHVVTVLGVKASTIYLLDKNTKRLEIGASYGLSDTYLGKGPVDAEKSIIESLAGNPVQISDAKADARTQYPEEAKRENISSILSVPMPVKGNVIGVLRIYSSNPREFTNDEVELVCSLAEMGGIAIENARMYHHLKMDYNSLFNDVHQWFEYGGPR